MLALCLATPKKAKHHEDLDEQSALIGAWLPQSGQIDVNSNENAGPEIHKKTNTNRIWAYKKSKKSKHKLSPIGSGPWLGLALPLAPPCLDPLAAW